MIPDNQNYEKSLLILDVEYIFTGLDSSVSVEICSFLLALLNSVSNVAARSWPIQIANVDSYIVHDPPCTLVSATGGENLKVWCVKVELW